MTSENQLMEIEAEIVGKVAKEMDNLGNQVGHNHSFCRGYLEGLEWVLEKLTTLREAQR